MAALDAALEYARQGFYVVPVRANGKAPWLKEWQKNASRDEAVIRSWWAERPDSNVGIATGRAYGCWVLDCDLYKPGVKERLSELQRALGVFETLTTKTARGGIHFYFKWPVSGIPAAKNPLGDGIDVKADGGQVLAPPSVVDGKEYTRPVEVPMAETPPELLGRLHRPNSSVPNGHRTNGNGGKLYQAPVWSEGQRDNGLTSMAGKLRSIGMSEVELIRLLNEMNELRCRPPLTPGDVKRIAGSIAKKEAGAEAAVSGESLSVGVADFMDSVKDDVNWLVDGIVAAGCWTLVMGPPKKGKTWFLGWLAATVAGRGHRVVFVEEEGAAIILKQRLEPFLQPDPRSFNDSLRVVFRKGLRLDDAGLVAQLTAECQGAAMIVLDPLACLHGRDENETHQMSSIATSVQALITATGAAIVLAHHTVKAQWGETDASSADARGSGALMGSVDIAYSVKGVPESQRAPNCVKFKLENTDSRLRATEPPRTAVIAFDAGVASLAFEDSVKQESPTELLERILPLVPVAPASIDRETLRKAIFVRTKRLTDAVALGIQTGVFVRAGYRSGLSRPAQKVTGTDE